MDINKLFSDLQEASKDEIAELWALLKEDGNHLVAVAKEDLGVGAAKTQGDPVPPDPTHPPKP